MNSSLSNLPLEVLRNIFKYVDVESKQTVFQCQLVCRQWQLPAQQVAYSSVILSRPQQVSLLCNTFKGNNLNSLKPFVKTIQLSFQDSYHSRVYLTLLSDLFPFVQYFTSLNTDEHTFNQLTDLKTSSDWKNLKLIPFVFKDNLIEAYNQCAYSYRKSLTHLHLFHVTLDMKNCLLDPPATPADGSVNQLNIRSFKKFSHNLDKFSNLKKLRIYYYGQDFFYKFNKEFAMSQTLNAVHLENYKKEASQLSSVNVDTEKIIARPNIKELSGEFFINDNNTLRYIMRIFTNLNILKVNNTRYTNFLGPASATHVQISTIHNVYLSQFIFFVKKIPCHNVTLPVKDVMLLAGFFNSLASSKPTSSLPNDYWIFIVGANPELVGSKSLLPMTSPNLGDCGSASANTLEYNIFNPCRSYLKFIQYNGKHIAHLRFNLVIPSKQNAPFQQILFNPHFFDQQNMKSLHSNCLDNIFKHCTNLKQLQLISWFLKDDYSKNVSISTSISHLTLMYTDMKGFHLSTLSQRLPSLKHLKLEFCEWSNDEENSGERSLQQNWNISMPFSTLDSVCFSQNCSLENIYLHVDTSMNGSKYFNIIIDYEGQRFFTTQLDQNNYALQTGYDDDYLKVTVSSQSLERVQLLIHSKESCKIPIDIPLNF